VLEERGERERGEGVVGRVWWGEEMGGEGGVLWPVCCAVCCAVCLLSVCCLSVVPDPYRADCLPFLVCCVNQKLLRSAIL